MRSPFSRSLGVRPHGPRPIPEDCLRPRGSGNHWHPGQDTLQKTLHLRRPQTQADTGGEAQHPFCHQKVGGKEGKGECLASRGLGDLSCVPSVLTGFVLTPKTHFTLFYGKELKSSFFPPNLCFPSLSLFVRMWQGWPYHGHPRALSPCCKSMQTLPVPP